MKKEEVKEEWKDISGYEGIYKVSNLGNIKKMPCYHNKREHPVPCYIINSGYMAVRLVYKKIHKHYLVHRLVASAFLQNHNNLPLVNHKDENKLNNHADNLEWCDGSYNNLYGSWGQKQRLSHLKSLETNKRAKKVRCIELDIIYNSINEAARQMGLKRGATISAYCKEGRTSRLGHHWEFV